MDFTGGRDYRLKVIFEEQEEDTLSIVRNATEIIRERLNNAGFFESRVNYKREGEEYYIYVRVPADFLELGNAEGLISQKGEFEIWGEKGEEMAEDSAVEVGGEEIDPIKQYLTQGYRQVEIDLSKFKGLKVGYKDEAYYIGIGLEEKQSEEMTNQLYTFWGKSLFVYLDGQIFPLDGKDLGEQFSTYGKIKSLKISGFSEKSDAKLSAALISSDLLPVDLMVDKSSDFKGLFPEEFLDKWMLGGFVLIISVAAILIVLFRKDGSIASLAFVLFLLFSLAVAKVFHLRLTMGTIFAFIVVVASFVGLVILSLMKDLKNGLSTHMQGFIRDKETINSRNNFLFVQLILSVIMFIFAPSACRYFSFVLIIGSCLAYIVLDQLFPFLYKIVNLIKRENQ
jgi:preprotein translocase subunit SecD